MRTLSNGIAGAAGMVVLLGALAATPNAAYGQHARGDAEGVREERGRVALSSNRGPDLGECEDLAAPEGHMLAFRTYAEGVQIYIWNGSAWVFDAPEATLYADPGLHSQVGTHYRGPTWESNSGSLVRAGVDRRCPSLNSIDWLRLKATYSAGPGIFDGVTYVLRVNTAGGTAPTEPGDFPGQEMRVPYTTEYYFYREMP